MTLNEVCPIVAREDFFPPVSEFERDVINEFVECSISRENKAAFFMRQSLAVCQAAKLWIVCQRQTQNGKIDA